jgi:pimeloyl-ACP methyl ester carboxylesterase
MSNPIILIHGYSDSGESFQNWKQKLTARGYKAEQISICSYVSLSNELTIKDIAEGFNRALEIQAGLEQDEPFDAIVHSTGMLVIRSWLATYPSRLNRLKHLVGIAPASYGSPLAHKGRSWLGAMFKGNREFGPDFMEAGDQILDGLELGSKFTWDLAHTDLLGQETFYGPTKKTPYVFIFCGNKGYGGLRRLVNEPGTDGTVRWAGCGLNTRKITLDLTRNIEDKSRIRIEDWSNVDIPVTFVDGLNHGTILSDPSEALVNMADRAFQVSSSASFEAWQAEAAKISKPFQNAVPQYQQFVVHTVDERGDPVRDFNVQLFTRDAKAKDAELVEFDLAVHTYSTDPSYRCLHVNLSDLKPERINRDKHQLWIRVRASTGSQLVGYQGYGAEAGSEEVNLELTSLIDDATVKLFYPFTTTLVEVKVNREPLPLSGKNDVLWFLKPR